MNTLGSYAQTELSGMTQTEVESRALIRTASRLNQIKENWNNDKASLNEALEKNRRLWSILVSAMKEDDCPQPIEIKQNILSLANFIFKRTMDILVEPTPEKLDILISINMNIARGLSGSAE
ncbi:MAG: flagellar biosynthesis regulator FlaF [Alphaproteobacteria bacterium]|nr:flagellar biosynthesis regulator FlaF [Alphaproteobacteria bacterium]